MSSSGYSFFQAVQDTIVKGVHEMNFKNGIFVNSIPTTTPTADAMNILATSPHLTPSEREIFNNCRNAFTAVRNRFPGDAEPGPQDVFPFMRTIDEVWRVFKSDAQSRGLYIPPTTVQTLNSDDEFIKGNEETLELFAQGNKKGNAPPTSEDKKASRKDDKIDFGQSFSKNLRGAFM